MSTYVLNIDIASSDLATIVGSGQQLSIIKSAAGGTPVSWVTFTPFENNTITWTEDYYLYASQTEVQASATIQKLSQTAGIANESQVYSFSNSVFSPGSASTLEGYLVQNAMTMYQSLTFGLAQGLTVNGTAQPTSPINAQVLPRGFQAQFIPYETVILVFNNTIITSQVYTRTASESDQITFGPGTSTQTVSFSAGKWLTGPLQP
jgi:hypothetical protein